MKLSFNVVRRIATLSVLMLFYNSFNLLGTSKQHQSALFSLLLAEKVFKLENEKDNSTPSSIQIIPTNESNKNDNTNKNNNRIYDKQQLTADTANDTRKNVVFIVVGAVRTLQQTQKSIMDNVIRILCPPSHCTSHLVMHLSYADNRPDIISNDPLGRIIKNDNNKKTNFFRGIQDSDHSWPSGCIQYHVVQPTYDIGSDDEQQMMDTYEKEFLDDGKEDLSSRLHIFRHGDPRRYSMWFARAWAWRYIQREIIHTQKRKIDFFMFLRPDIFWFQPTPTLDFFQHIQEQEKREVSTTRKWRKNKGREVFLHDTYYSQLPDTFAFLPTYDVAHSYLSLENLVKPGVLCLGGPNFDKNIAKERLRKKRIWLPLKNVTDELYWCRDETQGWSESILGRKVYASKLSNQPLPAGAIILRPNQNRRYCEPLVFKRYSLAEYEEQHIPYFTCELMNLDLLTNWTKQQRGGGVDDGTADYMYSSLATSPTYLATHPFRYRNRNNATKCLTLIPYPINSTTTAVSTSNTANSTNFALVFEPCKEPIRDNQLFAGSIDTKIYGYQSNGNHFNSKKLIDVTSMIPSTDSTKEIIRDLISPTRKMVVQEPVTLFSKSFTASYRYSRAMNKFGYKRRPSRMMKKGAKQTLRVNETHPKQPTILSQEQRC